MPDRPLIYIRDDLLRLAADLGPHAEQDPSGHIGFAIERAHEAAQDIHAAITSNLVPEGPRQ